LVHGDFLAHVETAPVPDLIFHDPFSAKSDGALWTPAVFARMRARCDGRRVELFTYSASTAVRAALLHAGFCVAAGVGSGPKESTTIAFLAGEAAGGGEGETVPLPRALGVEWLARWRRSGSKFPAGLNAEEQAAFAARIEGHRQFAGEAGGGLAI
jgi:queuine tRNA-ribosyltransferase